VPRPLAAALAAVATAAALIGASSATTPGGCTGPATLSGTPGRGLTRTSCDADAVVYLDDTLRARPAGATAWIAPFTADVWRHIRTSYGSCVVDRPGCADFGGPVVATYRHSPGPGGGTIRYRFDPATGYRPTIDVTGHSWAAQDPVLRDVIVHEACHHAEFDGQGILDSPAFDVWGDSKWAEFCLFDFYTATGRTADAERVRRQFLAGRDGAHRTAWFRDWFLPLWEDGGRTADVQRRFFELLARHFPSRDAGGHGRYLRRMTTAEYVHFTSAAAGKDLSGRAARAFGAGFDRTGFAQARREFPALTY
jgi:hypothetical protein